MKNLTLQRREIPYPPAPIHPTMGPLYPHGPVHRGGGFLLLLVVLLTAACSIVPPTTAPLGTEQNPVKLALAPTTETQKALPAVEPLTRLLSTETGLRFKLSVPTSREAVIEAMSTNNVDLGWLPPLAYLVARDRIGVEPLLANVRHGSATAVGQIVVRTESGITSLDGLRNARFAFPDERSVTGYLMPRALLAARGVVPNDFFAETIFAGSTDAVLRAVSSRSVDGGAVAADGAAALQHAPPVLDERFRVVAQTAPVPNETLSLRKGIPPALARKLADGLLRVAANPAGAQLLRDLYNLDGLAPITDDAYEPLRTDVRLLNLNLDAALAQRRALTN